MTMNDHPEPPFGLLARLQKGEIDNADIELLEAMLRAEGLEDCPPWLQMRASRLAQAAATAPQPNGRLDQVRYLARLIFDSWSTPQLAPIRSHGTMERQLLLRADTVEISLHLQPVQRNRMTVIGQVLGHNGEAGEMTLRPHDSAAPTSVDLPSEPDGGAFGPIALDPLGEFVVPHVSPGRYVLSVRFATKRIDSEVLELRDMFDGTVT
jgi:hypothetical protein